MSKTHYLSVRVNGGLKADFWSFCEGVGMSASAAISLLAKRCVSEGRIPFEVVSPENALLLKARKGDNGFSDVRTSFRMSIELREQFSNVCTSTLGIPMSTVVKAFMVQCVDRGSFPFDDFATGNRRVSFLD